MGTLGVQEITKEQLKELSDTEHENVIVGWNGERAVLWKTTCHADHCTPEEREVIEAALAWYEWVDQLRKLSDAEVELVNAASKVRHRRLLAARAEGEEK